MPELPEVERAARMIRSVALGKRVIDVETTQDEIVFSGTTPEEFATEIKGRTVKSVGRYGKVFYIELDGKGKMPVFHFGMTGMLQIKGQLATYYKETPRKASTDWPPRFMKFILHIRDDIDESITELAFLDARRLGRIRLCASPLSEPPISSLGFDPILCMPPLEDFKRMVNKRSCPVKALLLDQSFSAGVGNWVADEILYNARIHPEQRCNTLSDENLETLHKSTLYVCQTAVEANADDSKFPENWLFKHRWGKGKKKNHTLMLPTGEPATIKWLTVGGRTSAYVTELQRLSSQDELLRTRKQKKRGKSKSQGRDGSDSSDLTSLEGSPEDSLREVEGDGKKDSAILSRSKFFPVDTSTLQGVRRVTRSMSTNMSRSQEIEEPPKKKRKT